jgi:hypothetical protein
MARRTTLLALLLCLVGCVRSINPVYTNDTLVADPTLLGSWTDEDGETVVVTGGDGGTYRLAVHDDGKTTHLVARLTKVEDLLVADFTVDDDALPDSDVFKAHLLPLHSFFFVEKPDDATLNLRTINPDWIGQYLERHPDAVPHRKAQSDREPPLLTGSTEEVRAFLAKVVREPGALGEATVYRKTAAATAPAPGAALRP